jgi:hypothetical protein
MTAQNFGSFPAVFVAAINDATGITNTVAAAGTPQELEGALFVQLYNSLPAALVWTPASGELEVTQEQGSGKYLARFSPSFTIGTNAGVKIHSIGKNNAVVGVQSRDQEAATAVGTSAGDAVAVVDLVKGDKITVEQDVGTNGHAITTRRATLTLIKIG